MTDGNVDSAALCVVGIMRIRGAKIATQWTYRRIMESLYKVGDVVRVKPFKNCIFGISPDMRRYIGEDVVITRVRYEQGYEAFRYTIREDFEKWWWSDECFEPIMLPELPEFEGCFDLNILFRGG